MNGSAAFPLLARQNAWMNARVLALAARLPDAERHRDVGAFHGSLHRTLDHVLYGDLAFLSRLTGDPPAPPVLGETLHPDFADLAAARAATDARLLSWTASLSRPWLDASLTWTSAVDGATRTRPRWFVLAHLFNHQLHHRGQATTLLFQRGLDAGRTDLPFLPEFDHPGYGDTGLRAPAGEDHRPRLAVLADYGRWMDERLYACCAELDDATRRRDLGAFFTSIHGTLAHLVAVDGRILARLQGRDPAAAEAPAADFDALRARRAALDAAIHRWTRTVDAAALETTISFVGHPEGTRRTLPAWVMAQQLFGHQTHHRGQVTALLSQLGIDYGTTDLPFMPEAESTRPS